MPEALAAPSSGQVVIDWKRTALASAAAQGHPGPVVVLDLAIVHAAVYDAVNAIDRQHTAYAVSVEDAPAGASLMCTLRNCDPSLLVGRLGERGQRS